MSDKKKEAAGMTYSKKAPPKASAAKAALNFGIGGFAGCCATCCVS